MLFFTSLLGLLLSLTNALVITPRSHFDVIVIGGGPAGLSALSGLARVRRKALLIDSGEYRNGQTTHMHDVIGWDGVQPAYFRYEARRLLKHYKTIEMMNGTVTDIKRLPATNTHFMVSVEDTGGSVKQRPSGYTARKIVLATGLKDILPSTPGIEENWGRGIYSCPWCDGHEYADQPLGLFCPLDKVASYVRKVLSLGTDIVAFVNGTDTEEMRKVADQQLPQWEEYLKLHNVTIDNRTITSLERLKKGEEVDKSSHLPSVPKDDLFSVHFTEGEPVERVAFLSRFASQQRSDIGGKAGVVLTYGKLGVTSRGMLTNVPGIYAVGDANSDSAPNIPYAMYTGKKAAVAIHVALETEKQAAELAELASEV
ncbi:thioredoxin reductase [Fusarium mundagurra]|uniref:Thioredoxin reductase n=1 Tax=Fusarium mundagurra TaxID=1567541 RepID=A0A8H5Z7K1_9HYPO|nr:thioredoxin reductase [Fusarium mundagurra]